MTPDSDLKERATRLACSANLGPLRSLTPIIGGANNRVFLLETATRVALLKQYFHHPDDPRDRLRTEFALSRFAWNVGARAIPQPLDCDPAAGLGLFEYVRGRTLRPDEIDSTAIKQATQFVSDLNQHRISPGGLQLPIASEACFRLQDHLYLVSKRIERLENLQVQSDVDRAALDLVENRLLPAWLEIAERVNQHARIEKLSLSELLVHAERCLSPSDFGFHNAICGEDGRIRFIDFEYSGWDDPAKLICDFFCQPAVPVPIDQFDSFACSIAECMPSPSWHMARSRLLFPVYQLKWCCILLNEFLPAGSRRRQFSRSAEEQEQRKATQLAKAYSLLESFIQCHFDSRQAA